MNEETITVVKKPSKKKKVIIILIIVALVIAGIVGYICYYYSAAATRARQEKAELKWSQENIQSITEQASVVAEKYGIDLTCTYITTTHATYYSERFASLSPEEKDEFFTKLGIKNLKCSDGKERNYFASDLTIISGGLNYTCEFIKDVHKDYYLISCDEEGNIERIYLYHKAKSYSSNSNKNAGKDKCPLCNGTGYVRYYYGSSDLEALLSGNDPYTTGKCTMCDGTGYVD